MMRMGLQGKFMLSLLATALIWISVFSVIVWSSQRAMTELLAQNEQVLRDTARDALATRASQQAAFLGDALTNPVYYFDLLAIREVLRSALNQPDVRLIEVYDAQGRLIHDGSTPIDRFGSLLSGAAELSQAGKSSVRWSPDGPDASTPIRIGDLRLGAVRVGMSAARMEAAIIADTAEARNRLRASFAGPWTMFVVGLLTLLVWSALASWMVGRGLVRPIRNMAAEANDLEQGRAVVQLDSHRRDELGELIRAFGRMSSGVTRHREDMVQLAYCDNLSGLPNRLRFRELLDEAIQDQSTRRHGFALMFIDLDDFKRINDTLGHDVGDQVLMEFATRLRLACGQSGSTALARLGGDEFVALIPGPDAASTAARIADTILLRLQTPMQIADRALTLGASIGITRFPEDASSASMLLKQGDLAMYHAKQQGKRCYQFFASNLIHVAEETMTLEHDLRAAMDAGSLSLVYQPIYELATKRMISTEALLRWHHPERGDVPPSIFVPVAEATGLIDALGDWVMHSACRDAAEWQERLPGVAVAVNVSGRQFQRPGFPERIQAALKQHGLGPSLLHVELTESSLLHDEATAFAALAQLRRIGVKVWLDDFGTGFSGLSHVRRARVDGVKIDRSFIADVLTDPEDLALSDAIIAMAHSLDMVVIAEGVENQAQLDLLRARGCDQAQGFWLSAGVAAVALH